MSNPCSNQTRTLSKTRTVSIHILSTNNGMGIVAPPLDKHLLYHAIKLSSKFANVGETKQPSFFMVTCVTPSFII